MKTVDQMGNISAIFISKSYAKYQTSQTVVRLQLKIMRHSIIRLYFYFFKFINNHWVHIQWTPGVTEYGEKK